MKKIAKIVIRLIWIITILLADAILDSHYEYVDYTLKWDLYTGKIIRVYER